MSTQLGASQRAGVDTANTVIEPTKSQSRSTTRLPASGRTLLKWPSMFFNLSIQHPQAAWNIGLSPVFTGIRQL
jgi:hypothetical protein